jgi:hypothetical protein
MEHLPKAKHPSPCRFTGALQTGTPDLQGWLETFWKFHEQGGGIEARFEALAERSGA